MENGRPSPPPPRVESGEGEFANPPSPLVFGTTWLHNPWDLARYPRWGRGRDLVGDEDLEVVVGDDLGDGLVRHPRSQIPVGGPRAGQGRKKKSWETPIPNPDPRQGGPGARGPSCGLTGRALHTTHPSLESISKPTTNPARSVAPGGRLDGSN